MKPTVKHLPLGNGIALHVVERGSPAGTPVLLLHGVTDSWRSFEPVLPHLPDSIRAIAPSQRGHGDSDRPAGGYRTRDFAADAAALIDRLGCERAVIVGHSMGTANALRFALDYPDRTLGLVLVGAFAAFRHNAAVTNYWNATVRDLTDPIDITVAREFQESTLAQPIAGAFLDGAVNESLKVPARVWREAFAGMLEDDFADEIAAVDAPTLIVWGDRDAFCPREDQQVLLAAIPDSRVHVYEGTGHAVHWEQPARFAADLVDFVARLTARAPAAAAAHPLPA